MFWYLKSIRSTKNDILFVSKPAQPCACISVSPSTASACVGNVCVCSKMFRRNIRIEHGRHDDCLTNRCRYENRKTILFFVIFDAIHCATDATRFGCVYLVFFWSFEMRRNFHAHFMATTFFVCSMNGTQVGSHHTSCDENCHTTEFNDKSLCRDYVLSVFFGFLFLIHHPFGLENLNLICTVVRHTVTRVRSFVFIITI